MKKQTNTSVTAAFKNGEKKTFETIEEASEVTGLEINSIKARANKPGSGAKSKDGITFENIKMTDVLTPLVVNMFYYCDPDGHTEYVYSKEKLRR